MVFIWTATKPQCYLVVLQFKMYRLVHVVFDAYTASFICIFPSIIFQGFASDVVRYSAFFSYFTIQLAQLFLCCFADQPPEGKTILDKVGSAEHIENARAPILWFFESCRRDTFPT